MRSKLGSLALALMTMAVPPLAHAQWVPDGVALCQSASTQITAHIVSDGAGGAIVTWEDARNGGFDIYAQRVDAAGTPQWAADGVAVCTAANVQGFPRIVSDDAGGAIVTWTDNRSGVTGVYAQRVNAAGVPLWTADGVFLGTPATDPTTTADGAGGAIVTWQRLVASGNNDIYAQRVDAAGVPQWTAGGIAVCIAAGDQQDPVLVSDGAGGTIVTWYDRRDPARYEIYAQRVDASGVPQWMADGVELCNQWSLKPRIVSDGAGGAIVAWEDARGGPTWDVYARRVDASGVPQWMADGVALCTAANNQVQVAIAPDGAGGAIVTWQDARSPLGGIYAQRVNASGVPQWTANGVGLCTGVGVERPAIVSDGAGGAIVTWRDLRNPDSDIYAQWTNSSGVSLWPANGIPLCTATGSQASPQIASGAGAAIVAWDDQRSGSSDVYAANLFAMATGVGDLPAVGIPTLSVRPNPFAVSATVSFDLMRSSRVDVSVHDVAGRLVRRLTDDVRPVGPNAVDWDGLDSAGAPLPSGIYLIRLRADGWARSAKALLTR